jgi:hypothetical protein
LFVPRRCILTILTRLPCAFLVYGSEHCSMRSGDRKRLRLSISSEDRQKSSKADKSTSLVPIVVVLAEASNLRDLPQLRDSASQKVPLTRDREGRSSQFGGSIEYLCALFTCHSAKFQLRLQVHLYSIQCVLQVLLSEHS